MRDLKWEYKMKYDTEIRGRNNSCSQYRTVSSLNMH